MKKIFTLLTVLVSVASILWTGSLRSLAEEFEGQTVKIGVASDIEAEVWQVVADKAKKEGITLDITLFTDYVQPNEALANGSLYLNAFQHIAYLNEWNEANEGSLVPLGFTYVTSLGLYSEKVEDIKDIPKGATIAIPNDPTNGGRALLALQQAKFIKVDEAAGILPTTEDITDNPLELSFEEIDAAQLASVLPDVDAAFINNNFALDAGLSIDDAIFRDGEDLSALKDDYKNVVAVDKKRQKDPLLKHIVDLYQSKEVEEKLAELSDGGDIPAWEKK